MRVTLPADEADIVRRRADLRQEFVDRLPPHRAGLLVAEPEFRGVNLCLIVARGQARFNVEVARSPGDDVARVLNITQAERMGEAAPVAVNLDALGTVLLLRCVHPRGKEALRSGLFRLRWVSVHFDHEGRWLF